MAKYKIGQKRQKLRTMSFAKGSTFRIKKSGKGTGTGTDTEIFSWLMYK